MPAFELELRLCVRTEHYRDADAILEAIIESLETTVGARRAPLPNGAELAAAIGPVDAQGAAQMNEVEDERDIEHGDFSDAQRRKLLEFRERGDLRCPGHAGRRTFENLEDRGLIEELPDSRGAHRTATYRLTEDGRRFAEAAHRVAERTGPDR